MAEHFMENGLLLRLFNKKETSPEGPASKIDIINLQTPKIISFFLASGQGWVLFLYLKIERMMTYG